MGQTNSSTKFVVIGFVVAFGIAGIAVLAHLRSESLALGIAVHRGDVAQARKLLESGKYNVNATDEYGGYLNGACRDARPEMISLLIEFHADLNQKTGEGRTPLMVLIECDEGEREPDSKRLECMDLLIKAGADPSSISSYGDDALHKACSCGVRAEGYVDRLLKCNVPLNNRDNDVGYTPLHWLCAQSLEYPHIPDLKALVKRQIAVAKKLIQAGADVTLRDNYGDLPIDSARIRGNSELVKVLTEAGGKIGREEKLVEFVNRPASALLDQFGVPREDVVLIHEPPRKVSGFMFKPNKGDRRIKVWVELQDNPTLSATWQQDPSIETIRAAIVTKASIQDRQKP